MGHLIAGSFAYGSNASKADGTPPVEQPLSVATTKALAMKNISRFSFKDAKDIKCRKLKRATVHVRVKARDKEAIEDTLRSCYDSRPFEPRAVLGGEPYQKMRYALSNKGHFADIMSALDRSHTPIIPQTFSLMDPVQCKQFFAMAQGNLQKPDIWILKPEDGFGGEGIEVVADFQAQLAGPYGACSAASTARPYVVQRYIMPHLINKRKYHVRTFFLYKFRGGNAWKPDPEQSWHIKTGKLLFCSEPFASSSNPKLRSFATKCNLHNAMVHPNFGKSGTKRTDLVKWFLPFMKDTLRAGELDKLVGRMDKAMGTLSDAITTYAKKNGIQGNANESNWMILGCDFQIDGNFKPWLLEVNTCPGAASAIPGDTGTDPYPAMFQVMLTHYRRHFLKDKTYSERACHEEKTLSDHLSGIRFPDQRVLDLGSAPSTPV